jgi:hypothetical protein
MSSIEEQEATTSYTNPTALYRFSAFPSKTKKVYSKPVLVVLDPLAVGFSKSASNNESTRPPDMTNGDPS